MNRRGFLGLFGGTALAAAPRPTDPEALNAFAAAYNTYVERLKHSVIDTRQWERVRRAWRDLAGDPCC